MSDPSHENTDTGTNSEPNDSVDPKFQDATNMSHDNQNKTAEKQPFLGLVTNSPKKT